jgi:hypothetical protein
MTATEALQAARRFNVQINLCGGDLTLDAPEAPPKHVLDALRENKPEIIAILRASIRPAGYSDDEWLACPLWVIAASRGQMNSRRQSRTA